MKLKTFLDNKTMHYDKIDFSVISLAWETLKKHIDLPYVIHIVGTNGKGSTGRFIAYYLSKINKKVLHYSSPHIMKFNERIWIDGSDVSDDALEKTHNELLKILPSNLVLELTYFEYTTLLALKMSSNCEYIVLEAGLGGEFDATNVVQNDLSIVTTIDFDHEAFLGNTIESIALTKMRSVDKSMIVSYQIHDEVISLAKQLSFEKKLKLDFFLGIDKNIENFNLPKYLKQNLSVSIMVLKELNFDIDYSVLHNFKIKGRCEYLNKKIIIDVGHNPLSAQVVLEEFLQYNKKITLIYNSFEDKNYKKVLSILKPIIKKLLIIDIEDPRILKREKLMRVCKELEINQGTFTSVSKNETYLVFGSFLVVEKFLLFFNKLDFYEK